MFDIGEINKILEVLIFSPTIAIFVFVTVVGPSLYLISMISSRNSIMPKLIFLCVYLSVHQEKNPGISFLGKVSDMYI